MRKNQIFICLMIMAAISGCAPGENVPPAIMQEETGRETDTGSQDVVKNELTIPDIFIPEDECLKNALFMTGSMECVLKYNPELERVTTVDHGNGYLVYWKGDGIEYVDFCEDMDIYGIVITDHYSLNCGLKIGMEESDLQQKFPVMEKFEKGNLTKGQGIIVFSSSLMNDEMGPLSTTDYDYVYACACAASDEEVEEYQITGTIAYSVIAFIKNGKVCKIVLDLPTAG